MIDPQMLASLPAAAAVLSAAVRSGAGPVAQLMRAGGLYCVFQPLADLRSGSIYAPVSYTHLTLPTILLV